MSSPHFPILSVPNTRLDSTISQRTWTDIAWFSSLFEPSPWDSGSVRLWRWDEWPGPEDAGCLEFALQRQHFLDSLEAEFGSPVTSLFNQVSEDVRTTAQLLIPQHPGSDAWNAPTTAVWSAAWAAGLCASFAYTSWPVPDDFREEWIWLQSGHWPCGYEEESGIGPRRLLVM
jgi:hypothetical protein